jgi:hypothetical protein
MPLMTWQLRLAKDLVVENRLPWQSATINLTPGCVAQSMFSLAEFVRAGSPLMERTQALVAIGTPAQSPKPREKSPGWAKGNTRTKPPRYPTVKKADAYALGGALPYALREPQRALHQVRVSRPKKSPKVAV